MIISRAPLRISLGGGGTDFKDYYKEHGGHIVGFATQLYVYVIVKGTLDGKIHLKYSRNEVAEDPDDLNNRVAAECIKLFDTGQGLEIVTFSDVPESSGLGGSSAFCVALIDALHRFHGRTLCPQDVFNLAYEVERNAAGVAGGIQDQFFAAHGGAWTLHLKDGGPIQVSIPSHCMEHLLPNLRLVHTGEHRQSQVSPEEHQDRIEDKDESMLKNLEQVKFMSADVDYYIRHRETSQLAEIFNRHWCTKKARDPHTSTVYIDKMIESLREDNPDCGIKLIGSGGGGYLLAYTERDFKWSNGLHLKVAERGVEEIYNA